MVEERKGINDHYSMPHCGVEILSLSKRIMNEVMCLAEEKDINIFYTDTDSMHIDDSKISELSDAYRERFGRELIGNQMGQFHCDFDFECDKGLLPVSVEAYFLGKKSYIDKIEVVRGGNKEYEHHIRMKSIPNKCINEFQETEEVFHKLHEEISPMTLYEKMFNGKVINFDLLKCIKFKVNIDFTTSNHKSFNRRVSFPSTAHLVVVDE